MTVSAAQYDFKYEKLSPYYQEYLSKVDKVRIAVIFKLNSKGLSNQISKQLIYLIQGSHNASEFSVNIEFTTFLKGIVQNAKDFYWWWIPVKKITSDIFLIIDEIQKTVLQLEKDNSVTDYLKAVE